MGLNLVSCKHSFGSQIENNMLENHADQREMVIFFFITFLYVVVTSKAIKSDFPSATDWLLNGPKEDEKLRYSVYLLFWFARTSASAYRVAFSKASVLLNPNALNMWWKENFRMQPIEKKAMKDRILFAWACSSPWAYWFLKWNYKPINKSYSKQEN